MTFFVDGGYLSWVYGTRASTMNGWGSSRKKYSKRAGAIILMDHHCSSRKLYDSMYKSRRAERLLAHPERQETKENVILFQEFIREDPSLFTLEFSGLEADDLVAVAAYLYGSIDVIGADKDLLQLPNSPIKLQHIDGKRVTIKDYVKRIPVAIQSRLRSPRELLLCLALLGDRSDSVPRLIPAGELSLLQSILDKDKPFLRAHDRFKEEFEQNLYLVALPGPWCFEPIVEPSRMPELLETGEYYRQEIAFHLERVILQAYGQSLALTLGESLEKKLLKELGFEEDTW